MGLHGLQLSCPPSLHPELSSELYDIETDPLEYREVGVPSVISLHRHQIACLQMKTPATPAHGLEVTYDGLRGTVTWPIKMQALRKQYRCGQSRQFTLHVRGVAVTFLFMLVPASMAAGPKKGSSFRRLSTQAKMQLKCTDATQLRTQQVLFDVSFVAGSLPEHSVVCAHDFALEPLCAPAHDVFWDLQEAAGEDEQCLVKLKITQVLAQNDATNDLVDQELLAGSDFHVSCPTTMVYQ